MKCTDSIMNPRQLFLLLFCYCITLSLNFILEWLCFVGFVFMLMLGPKENSHNFFSSIKSTLSLTFIIKLIINLQIYRTTLLYTYYLRKSWARSLESLLEGHNCFKPVCQSSRRSIIVCFLSLLAKAVLQSSHNLRSAGQWPYPPSLMGNFSSQNSWKNLRNKCVFGFYALLILWLECTIGDRHLC
jgi:hypothetical protein